MSGTLIYGWVSRSGPNISEWSRGALSETWLINVFPNTFFFHISEVYGFSNHCFQTPASRPGWKHRFGKETHRHWHNHQAPWGTKMAAPRTGREMGGACVPIPSSLGRQSLVCVGQILLCGDNKTLLGGWPSWLMGRVLKSDFSINGMQS